MDEVITKDHWAAARDTLQEIVLNVVMACDTSSEQKGAQMRIDQAWGDLVCLC